MYCISYCVGNELNLNALDGYLRRGEQGEIYRHRGLLQLSLARGSQLIFFFSNGTLISWNIKRFAMKEWLQELKPFVLMPLAHHVKDEISYSLASKTEISPHGYFDIDCLKLENDSIEIKLSLSYGLSQSIKLQSYEHRLEHLIQKYTPMIETAKYNKVKLVSRRSLRKVIAELLIEKSELNLISNFLYQPMYFWQHPNLEVFYSLIENYMDIEKRITALNTRLDILNDIFDVINSYLETKHSHRLEVIIILLIAIEIIFNLLNFHF